MELLVKCVKAEVLEAPVRVQEELGLLHDCMRKVCFYVFEKDSSSGVSHPQVELHLREIGEALRFEVGKLYELVVSS